jgi:hypothetical protein
MHLDLSFAKPNAWIVDTETCRRHNLHLAVDGQAQRCNIVPVTQPCDNCLRQSRAVSGQRPPPIPDAQGAGDGARLFHERGSYVLDEFSSICCSRRAQLFPVSCLRRRWRLLSPQSKLSDFARWLPVLQMFRTTSEVWLSQFHSPVAWQLSQVPPSPQWVGVGQRPLARRKVWRRLPGSDPRWTIPDPPLGRLVLEPVGHVQGHAGVEKRRRGRRIGSMDGTENLGPIHYQLHTAGRCVHSNVGTRRSQKNSILGLKSCVWGLLAMAYCSCFLQLRRTSLYALAWGNRDSQVEERSPDGDRGLFILN